MLFLLLLYLSVYISTQQSCIQDGQCYMSTKPACVSSNDPRIFELSGNRSGNAFQAPMCGCYNDASCIFTQTCTSTSTTDPGVCGCTTAASCNPLYFDTCYLNQCYKSCSTNNNCGSSILPICVKSILPSRCGCTQSADCQSAFYSVCNTALGYCVPCVTSSDCHGEYNTCSSNVCIYVQPSKIEEDLNTIMDRTNSTIFVASFTLGIVGIFLLVSLHYWYKKHNRKEQEKHHRRTSSKI